MCGSCGVGHHRLCAAENKWLQWIGDESIGGKCFDCWLLEALLKGTAHPQQLKVYYMQQVDWSRVGLSPFCIGAILATAALSLQQVSRMTQRARHAPVTGKCKKCKLAGELLACSFCTNVYHNSDACLHEDKVLDTLAASACFPWACPTCFKKGIVAVQRAVLKPAGQRGAGASKPRTRRKTS